MWQLAIEEEVQNFISSYQDKLLTNGSKQVVRNGYLPERTIQTGIGEVAVKVPRVRDRGKEDIKFYLFHKLFYFQFISFGMKKGFFYMYNLAS